jgi:hypothetical protein
MMGENMISATFEEDQRGESSRGETKKQQKTILKQEGREQNGYTIITQRENGDDDEEETCTPHNEVYLTVFHTTWSGSRHE